MISPLEARYAQKFSLSDANFHHPERVLSDSSPLQLINVLWEAL